MRRCHYLIHRHEHSTTVPVISPRAKGKNVSSGPGRITRDIWVAMSVQPGTVPHSFLVLYDSGTFEQYGSGIL